VLALATAKPEAEQQRRKLAARFDPLADLDEDDIPF